MVWLISRLCFLESRHVVICRSDESSRKDHGVRGDYSIGQMRLMYERFVIVRPVMVIRSEQLRAMRTFMIAR